MASGTPDLFVSLTSPSAPSPPPCPQPQVASRGAEQSTEPLPPEVHSQDTQAPPGTLRGQNVTAQDKDRGPYRGPDASEPDFMTGGHRTLCSAGIVVSQAEEHPEPTPVGGCHGASPEPLPTVHQPAQVKPTGPPAGSGL